MAWPHSLRQKTLALKRTLQSMVEGGCVFADEIPLIERDASKWTSYPLEKALLSYDVSGHGASETKMRRPTMGLESTS